MLKIINQTNLDIILFISDDEPLSRITELVLGLLKKRYICEGIGATIETVMTDNDKNIKGLRARFTKSTHKQYAYRGLNSSYFKRNVNDNETMVQLNILSGTTFKRTEVIIRVTPSPKDCKLLLNTDIISRYSRHVKTIEDMTILPTIVVHTDIDDRDIRPTVPEKEEASEIHIDTIISRIKEFENNFKYLYPCLSLRNFYGNTKQEVQKMSLFEFHKFNKQIDILEQVSIPTNYSRQKFIDLCEIFKNNNILTKFKANNFEFRKNFGNYITVSFFGIPMIYETEFKVFKYFDHPSIDFCADFLDKSKTFDILEAKLSKEIITRI